MNLDLQLDQEEIVASSLQLDTSFYGWEKIVYHIIITGQILCVHDQCLLQAMHQRDEDSEILAQHVMFCCQDV